MYNPVITRLVLTRQRARTLQWRAWAGTVTICAIVSLLLAIVIPEPDGRVVQTRGTIPVRSINFLPHSPGGAGTNSSPRTHGRYSHVISDQIGEEQPLLPFTGDGLQGYDDNYDFGVPVMTMATLPTAVQPTTPQEGNPRGPRESQARRVGSILARRPSVWLPAINIPEGGATDPDIQFLHESIVTGRLFLMSDGTVQLEPDSIPTTRLLRWLTEAVRVQLSRSICSPALDNTGTPVTVSVPYECRFSRNEPPSHQYDGEAIRITQ